MKRKLYSFGIFSNQIVKGNKISNPYMISIYQKLKNIGFRETLWQYIFHGQIGGLVMPFNSGKNEIHVRFYKKRIFAEYEIGRYYVSHFLGRRYNANDYLYELLSNDLTVEERVFFREMLSEKRQLEDEIEMELWDKRSDPFTITRAQEHLIPISFIAFCLQFGWKTSFFIFILIYFIMAFSNSLLSNIFVAGISILVWKKLPSKGKS